LSLLKVNVPDPKDGEFLVRSIWMSVDPYMRGRMRETKSYISPFQIGRPLEGGCVGQITKSKNDQFRVGDYVLGNLGWREYWLSDGSGDVMKIDPNMATSLKHKCRANSTLNEFVWHKIYYLICCFQTSTMARYYIFRICIV
jgi:NADPH-dependent curcumin reductase CurA